MHDHAAMVYSHDRREDKGPSMGKSPMGKSPMGKSPMGKSPTNGGGRDRAQTGGPKPATPPTSGESGENVDEGPVRLNKFLAQSGLCSRRKADELIEAGRVSVNGQTARAGDRIFPGDEVRVDGKLVQEKEELVCLMLHKPPKVVSTAHDPQGRTTVLDFVPREYRHLRLYPVGRLDYLSEGLILLTNDGALAQRLAHPSNNQRKVYEVEVKGVPSERTLATLRGGMTLREGERTAPCEVEFLSSRGGKGAEKATLRFVLRQGLNRQIRRMCRDVGLEVTRLCRRAEGRLELGSLAPGRTRTLGEEDLLLLREEEDQKMQQGQRPSFS